MKMFAPHPGVGEAWKDFAPFYAGAAVVTLFAGLTINVWEPFLGCLIAGAWTFFLLWLLDR